jgi:hypothetical protein
MMLSHSSTIASPTRSPSSTMGHAQESATSWSGAGCSLISMDTTTPNEPPPPPRSAQNRSLLAVDDAVSRDPSAVTSVTECMLSAPRPRERTRGPARATEE